MAKLTVIRGTKVVVSVIMVAFVLRQMNVGVKELRGVGPSRDIDRDLHLIRLAISNYEERTKSRLPAYVVDANGAPLYSWRVLVACELISDDTEDLADRYSLNEAWNSVSNQNFVLPIPTCFEYEGDVKQASVLGWTSYVGVSEQGEYVELHGHRIPIVSDVRLETDSGIVWTEPRDRKNR